jgi:beta-phosphoglucomutase-like phosphatase (HAD superfamily)
VAQMKALIFDQDGVIADTERDGHRVAFNRVFEEEGLGVSWSVERYGQLLKIAGGKERMKTVVYSDDFAKDVGDKEAYIKKLHKRKTDIFMEIVSRGQIALRSGVARLVREAHQNGLKLAVCSTSNERAVHTLVKAVGRGGLRRVRRDSRRRRGHAEEALPGDLPSGHGETAPRP